MARRTCASSPGRLPAVSISIAFRYCDRSSNCWYRGSAPGTFCPWRGRAHFLRWAPIMGILRYPDDLKVSGMLEIIAEVFSDRVAVFEIFLLKEAVDDSDVARGWRVLFILGTAFDCIPAPPPRYIRRSRAHGSIYFGVLRRVGSCAAAAATQQVNCGAQLKQGIVGWVNAVHPRDWIEDDLLLFMGLVEYGLSERKQSQLLQFAALRPMNGYIIDRIAVFGQLSHDSEFDRLVGNAVFYFLEEIIWRLSRYCCSIQMFLTGHGEDAIAPVTSDAVFVEEAHRGEAVIRFAREARGRRLRR